MFSSHSQRNFGRHRDEGPLNLIRSAAKSVSVLIRGLSQGSKFSRVRTANEHQRSLSVRTKDGARFGGWTAFRILPNTWEVHIVQLSPALPSLGTDRETTQPDLTSLEYRSTGFGTDVFSRRFRAREVGLRVPSSARAEPTAQWCIRCFPTGASASVSPQ